MPAISPASAHSRSDISLATIQGIPPHALLTHGGEPSGLLGESSVNVSLFWHSSMHKEAAGRGLKLTSSTYRATIFSWSALGTTLVKVYFLPSFQLAAASLFWGLLLHAKIVIQPPSQPL